MCGILLNIGQERIVPDHQSLECIKHRGPDDCGVEHFELSSYILSLGHRRLSIIDLTEKGRQPMSYNDGQLWITYNGEIYNYVELKKELSEEGFIFKSECDTEVLLAAYKKWGRACLERLNGMFAFAIYDRSENKVFVARDRFGIKPLFYYNSSIGFRLCSEMKQLISVPGFSPKADSGQLYHFLNTEDLFFRKSCMWKGVSELPPGHCFELNLNTWGPGNELKTSCWYDLPLGEKCGDISFEDAALEFRNRLNDAVKLRLRSDVPLGFFLSGGLDSSTVVAMAARLSSDGSEHLKTFSSCYKEKALDEREYIETVVKKFQVDHFFHFPEPDEIIADIDKIIWYHDLPVSWRSPCPQRLLYKYIARENPSRKVILEGTGADEYLFGYLAFCWTYFRELFSQKAFFTLLSEMQKFRRVQGYSLMYTFCKFREAGSDLSTNNESHSAIDTAFFAGNEGVLSELLIERDLPGLDNQHRSRFKILERILRYTDRNSMSVSCEARVPFMDHRLIEFCLKLPSAYKMRGGITKRILREAVKDLLPENILKRTDKLGYPSPVAHWAETSMKAFFKEKIEEVLDLPFVRPDELKRRFMEFENGAPFDPIFWRLIVVKRWMNIFKVSI